jgi:hypothetical protein
MSTVDFRTRLQGDDTPLDPSTFTQNQMPALVEVNGKEAGRAAERQALAPLTLDVEGELLTFVVDGERLAVKRIGVDGGGGLLVALDRSAFSDLFQDVVSTFGVQMMGRAAVRRGSVDDFVAWEPALRTFLDGRPPYEPGAITFRDKSGRPLNLKHHFTLDDDPEDLGHFLAEAGFLHIRDVFTEAEMKEVSRELEDAMASAERDDGASWWARTESGEWYAARILGFNQQSPALRALLGSDRFKTLGTFTDDSYLQRNPNVGDSAEGLTKKIGVVEGISDVSWHKDCSMGGHSRGCCGLTVGLSVTGAGPESGELGVVAGSHRANVAPLGIEGIDLPRLPLATSTGDITIHCSCTLHMSRPPKSAERRVVYTGFNLAPRAGDRPLQLTAEQVRNDRASIGNRAREHQRQGALGRTASFDL